jgi:hypothetical protein
MPNTMFTSGIIKNHLHSPACNPLDGSFLQAHALKDEPLRMATVSIKLSRLRAERQHLNARGRAAQGATASSETSA